MMWPKKHFMMSFLDNGNIILYNKFHKTMAKIFFFGYGANKDARRLEEILGKPPEGGQGAILENFSLAIQNLSQIPPSARQILKKIWGDDFQAYTICKGTGFVEGKIWLIEEEDVKKIEQWEFVGDDNWREMTKTEVKTADGKTISVLTEKSRDSFPVE